MYNQLLNRAVAIVMAVGVGAANLVAPVNVGDGTTLALYHFDGDMVDSSNYHGAATYVSGNGSFLDTDVFGQGLSLMDTDLVFTIPEQLLGDWTLEMRVNVVYRSSGFPTYFTTEDAHKTKSGTANFFQVSGDTNTKYTAIWSSYAVERQYPIISIGNQPIWSTGLYPSNGGHTSPSLSASTGDIIVHEVTDVIGPACTYAVGDIIYKRGKDLEPAGSDYCLAGDTSTALSQTLLNNGWHTVALVKSGDSLQMYVDGTARKSVPLSGALSNGLRLQVDSVTFKSFAVDELRLSCGALYTGNYTVANRPFESPPPPEPEPDPSPEPTPPPEPGPDPPPNPPDDGGGGIPGSMSDFLRLANGVLGMMRIPVTIYGFTFTFLDLFVYTMLVGFLLSFLAGLFRS